jgi:putative membrane protein
MRILVQLILAAIAVLISAYLLPGVHVHSFFTALVIAGTLALLNMIVKPILVLLTIPITIVTLGLFLLVINAIIILIAEVFIPGFYVDGFWWAFLFSLILAIFNSIFGVSLGKK